MAHATHRVRSFEIVDSYTLRVGFEDGASREIDFRPILEGGLYGPLRDLSLFNQVRIDTEVHTLVWPNGADFDPATLHDWPEGREEFQAMAQRWAAACCDRSETPN